MNQITGSFDLIKRINRKLVLEKIKEKQPISRAQLAKELSLSKTTVSAIADELLEKKLITDLGERVPTKGSGRPSKMLGFNPHSACLLGVDLTLKDTVILITDLNGEILFHAAKSPISSASEIVLKILETLREAQIPQQRVIGLGISIPGSVSTKGMVIRANAFGWLEFDLKQHLKPYFSFPVFVNNVANCAALGERWRGAGEQADDLFYLVVGPGVGSAFLCHGNLIYGADSRSGEVGYTVGKEQFEQGTCNISGKPGLFEEKIERLMQKDEAWKEAPQGQPLHEAARECLGELALLIGNAVNLLNPRTVLIGGRHTQTLSPYLPHLKEMVQRVTPLPVNLAMATLGREAPALGAAAEAMECIQQLGTMGE